MQSTPPIILDNLEPNAIYEAFIVAVNAHGKSYPSPRLIFQTKPVIETDPITPAYNMTTCCKHSGYVYLPLLFLYLSLLTVCHVL
jgi:hypothetical protein